MKKSYNVLVIIVFAVISFSSIKTSAQWNVGGWGFNRWAQTNNQNDNQSIRRVGIGDFSQTQGPRAALNIDANLLLQLQSNAGNYFLPGEVFRTDGPSNNINAWRLWTGGQNPATPATEKFALFVPGGSNNVFMRASATASRMYFLTGGVLQENHRMVITQNANNETRVGIGTDNPEYTLEIANGDIAITSVGSGIILKAIDGDNYYRITVDNDGNLQTQLVDIK